jgi:hypothetical protein
VPNILAHIGVQGFLTRTIFPKADLKLILLGCLLPDVPWILARVGDALPLGLDPYTLRPYAIAQASLFVTLFLCGVIAAVSINPKRVFAILSVNVVLHLILDALQTKWANGVHFFAPLSWELLNFGLFWPESLPTYLLTFLGLAYACWALKRALAEPFRFSLLPTRNVLLSIGSLITYLVLPLILLDGPLRADNHFVRTIRDKIERPGKRVEFDRVLYEKGKNGDTIETFGDERIRVLKNLFDAPSQVSVRGRFIDSKTLEIFEIHKHVWWFRDGSSFIGIMLIISMWAVAGLRR